MITRFNNHKSAYKYKALIVKTLKDFKLDTYFSGIFGTAITFLIPIIEDLLYAENPNINLSVTEICQLVAFCIAEILHINDNDIKRLKEELKKHNLIELIPKVKVALSSIYNLTLKIGETIGRTISKFIEMFSYVNVFVPIWQSISELTQQNDNNISLKILSLSDNDFYLKSIITEIIDNLEKKSNQ